MNATLALVRYSLRRTRTLIVVMLAVLAGFEVLLVVAGETMQASGTFSNFVSFLPPFVHQMFGDSLVAFMSFGGFVCFGYFHPMIVAALCAFVIALATQPVAEIETRFLDLILARPLRRTAVVARTTLLVVVMPACVVGAMALATLTALRAVAPGGTVVRPALLASLALNLWLVVECIGGVSLAVASVSRRRSTAAGIVGVGALVLFLADYLARIWQPAATVARLSPFHYYDAMAMVMGRPLPGSHVSVLGITAAAGIALAFVLFSRRDV